MAIGGDNLGFLGVGLHRIFSFQLRDKELTEAQKTKVAYCTFIAIFSAYGALYLGPWPQAVLYVFWGVFWRDVLGDFFFLMVYCGFLVSRRLNPRYPWIQIPSFGEYHRGVKDGVFMLLSIAMITSVYIVCILKAHPPSTYAHDAKWCMLGVLLGTICCFGSNQVNVEFSKKNFGLSQ